MKLCLSAYHALQDNKYRLKISWAIAGLLLGMGLTASKAALFSCTVLASDNQIVAGQPKLIVQMGHATAISAVAVSRDQKYVVTGGCDAAILWDFETGRELRRFQGDYGCTLAVAISPDSRYVIIGGGDSTYHSADVRMWDMMTGDEIRRLWLYSVRLRSLAYSEDGRFILTSGSDMKTRLWDATTGKQVLQVDGSPGGFVSGGNSIWTAKSGDKGIIFWDRSSGTSIRQIALSNVNRLSLSSDGQIIVVPDEQSVKLYDSRTGSEVKQIGGKDSFSGSDVSAALTPDGKLLIGHTADRIQTWDVESGKMLRQLWRRETTNPALRSVVTSPDGRFILAGMGDGTARIWEISTGHEIRRFEGISRPVMSVKLTTDSHSLLIGMEGGEAALWDVRDGREVRRFEGGAGAMQCAALSSDGKYALTGTGERTLTLWDSLSARPLRLFTAEKGEVDRAYFSPDGQFILSQWGSDDYVIRLWEVATGRQVAEYRGYNPQISPDGNLLFIAGNSDKLSFGQLWDIKAHIQIGRLKCEDDISTAVFSPDGKSILSGGGHTKLAASLWDVETGREKRRFVGHAAQINCVCFTHTGKQVLTGGDDRAVILWDIETARELRRIEGELGEVSSIDLSGDDRLVVIGCKDGTVRICNLATGEELCRLISIRAGGSVVVDKAGRFDTDDLEAIRGLHWLLPDNPMGPLPLEIFMRDFYEPQLLARLVAGEQLRAVPELANLTRFQPHIRITEIMPQETSLDTDTVSVSVEVMSTEGTVIRDGKAVKVESGAFDLRLFRDGQLVGYAPEDGGSLHLESGKASVTFKDIRIPRKTNLKQVNFSAYAFNRDRIKSQTDLVSYSIPKEVSPLKGRAYVITFGVNAYENSDFNLNFAADDSRAFQSAISDALTRVGEFREVIQIPLMSDYELRDGQPVVTSNLATKACFKGILDLLAGRTIGADIKPLIPNLSRISRARPEDVVLLCVSSHGYADPADNFYIVPYDTGEAPGISEEFLNECFSSSNGIGSNRTERCERAKAFLKRCISSEEIAIWLRDVDAGELVMIIDACHAAAVAGKEFKPGPMGSRGLGQLSYDKGMRILAATQAEGVALEKDQLKQGLLTYALIQEGIKAGKADFSPTDGSITLSEWLRYGVDRVPKLFEEARSGDLQKLLVHGRSKGARERPQQPSLFDFAKSKQDSLLARILPDQEAAVVKPQTTAANDKVISPNVRGNREVKDPIAEPGAKTFAGEWALDKEGDILTIAVDGNRATGQLSGHPVHFSGTVNGGVMEVQWVAKDEPTGRARFELSPDGRSLEGFWTDEMSGEFDLSGKSKMNIDWFPAHRRQPYERPNPSPDFGTQKTIVPAYANGYKYKQVIPGQEAGFERPDFDETSFKTGAAPFALYTSQCIGCSEIDMIVTPRGLIPHSPDSCKYFGIRTLWQPDAELLLRKAFTLPEGAHNLKVVVAVEGAVQVFFNGFDISGGLRKAFGCAHRLSIDENYFSYGNLMFTVPDGILRRGDNLIAVRGKGAYLNVQVVGRLNSPDIVRSPKDSGVMNVFTFLSPVEARLWRQTIWEHLEYSLSCSTVDGLGLWSVQFKNTDQEDANIQFSLNGISQSLIVKAGSKGEFARSYGGSCDTQINLMIGSIKFGLATRDERK